MSGDLDSILNDDEQPVAAVEPAAEPEAPTEPEAISEPVAEEAKSPTRDEKGRFAPKGETESVSPTPVNAEPALDHAAVLGERRRRQDAEARVRELEARFASQQPQQFAPPPQAQQPARFEFNEDLYWSNPQQFLDGFANHIRQGVMSEVQSVIPQTVLSAQLDRSEQLARARYEDYDPAFAAFRDAVAVNPSLGEKLAVQADPGEFAYQEGKRLLEMANFGSANEYIEAEVTRRLAEQQQVAKPAPVIPVSLAGAPAAGASSSSPTGPLSLDAIIGSRG